MLPLPDADGEVDVRTDGGAGSAYRALALRAIDGVVRGSAANEDGSVTWWRSGSAAVVQVPVTFSSAGDRRQRDLLVWVTSRASDRELASAWRAAGESAGRHGAEADLAALRAGLVRATRSDRRGCLLMRRSR